MSDLFRDRLRDFSLSTIDDLRDLWCVLPEALERIGFDLLALPHGCDVNRVDELEPGNARVAISDPKCLFVPARGTDERDRVVDRKLRVPRECVS